MSQRIKISKEQLSQLRQHFIEKLMNPNDESEYQLCCRSVKMDKKCYDEVKEKFNWNLNKLNSKKKNNI